MFALYFVEKDPNAVAINAFTIDWSEHFCLYIPSFCYYSEGNKKD